MLKRVAKRRSNKGDESNVGTSFKLTEDVRSTSEIVCKARDIVGKADVTEGGSLLRLFVISS